MRPIIKDCEFVSSPILSEIIYVMVYIIMEVFMTIYKYIKFYLIILILAISSLAYSLESVRVMVLPFEIEGREDYLYLGVEIQNNIRAHLEDDGAISMDSSSVFGDDDKGLIGIDDMCAMGATAGADYLVLGKQVWKGDRFLLNVRILEVSTKKLVDSFGVEGGALEDLPGIAKQFSSKIISKIFKQEIVARIIISGNKRIETDVIKKKISTSPGEIYLLKNFSKDLKALYAMGYFDDIRIETEESPDGKVVIFKVKEKPSIKTISFRGLGVFTPDEAKENLTIKDGSILNVFEIRRNIVRMEELYKEKQYHNVKITYETHDLGDGRVDLKFILEEGKKVKVRQIVLMGNSIYSDKELKKMMSTKEKGFFSFLTSSGVLNKEDLYQDAARLYAFYHNNGYMHAKIGEPEVEYEGEWIKVTIRIQEGEQFKVGKVDLDGDSVIPKDDLLKALEITKETFYNREVIRNDILALTDLYSDLGYAYVDISPRIKSELDIKIVNITYAVSKGEKVYFEKILITGNSKTRDKVIRRELPVIEQGPYSRTALKRAERNLVRLDFFEDLSINTSRGSSDDKMVLKINVKEKPTGSISFGGGFSSEENAFVMASLSQKNLFGRGQILSLKAELGSKTTSYTIDFKEPWIFDSHWSGGINLYNWKREYDYYDTDRQGGGFYVGYPVFDYTRVSCSYSIDMGDISDYYYETPESIYELNDQTITSSSLTARLNYDSRNKAFNATSGSDHSISLQYSGIGGDVGYTKVRLETGWYFPLFWKFVGFAHGKTGIMWKNSGKVLPDYDLFRLGGINSLRGFEWEDLAPKETIDLHKRYPEHYEEGHVVETEVGGYKFVQANFECLFPFDDGGGIMGFIFFDTGELYDDGEKIKVDNLRESIGFGVRWNSPMGPLRLEYGYILDPKKDAGEGGRFEFSMGAAF